MQHCNLDAADLAAIETARTPATRLGYALQLSCLRYPGRHLRQNELLPALMLDHIAEQVGVEPDIIAHFARRNPTRYDQLAGIKARFRFRDLGKPLRAEIMAWLIKEAKGTIDGRILLDGLLDEMRRRLIVIPGVSVVERMAAEAMHRAETNLIAEIEAALMPIHAGVLMNWSTTKCTTGKAASPGFANPNLASRRHPLPILSQRLA